MTTEEQDKKKLEDLGFRVKEQSVRYIYNKGKIVGRKIFYKIERKEVINGI